MEEFAFETVKTEEIKDRKVAGIIALSAFVLLLAILHFLGYRIPTPPLPEQLLYKDMEMELIEVELQDLPVGTGGGGSGTAANVEQSDRTPPQTQQVLTQHSSSTHTSSGNSSINNTQTPTDNPASAQNTSSNPFGGTGGSGGGTGTGNGHGIGNDNGNGEGNGNGPGRGGDPERHWVEKPNTNSIQTDESCVIVLSILVDPNGNIIGKPTFVKNGSNTNDMTIINQVINVVKNQGRFNKVTATKNMKVPVVIRISAN